MHMNIIFDNKKKSYLTEKEAFPAIDPMRAAFYEKAGEGAPPQEDRGLLLLRGPMKLVDTVRKVTDASLAGTTADRHGPRTADRLALPHTSRRLA